MLTDIGDRYTAARLDRLAPVREVAQIGAALGRQFSHELIAAVALMPQRQLDDGLAQLVGAELIYRRGTPPDAEYTFKQALVASRGWGAPELGEAYARARQLSPTLNRPRATLFALYGEYLYHTFRGDLERAAQLTAEIRDLGESDGAAAQMIGYNVTWYIHLGRGEFAAARVVLEKALAQFDPAFRPVHAELLPADLRVLLLAHSSQALVCLGDLDRALSRCEAAVAEARRLSDPHNLAIALGYAWQARRCVGSERASLLQRADELLALAVEHELAQYRNVSLMFRGWSLAALGRPDDSIPLLTRGMAGIDAVQLRKSPWRLTLLADGCHMAGQLPAALAHLAKARRLVDETENRPHQAETRGCRVTCSWRWATPRPPRPATTRRSPSRSGRAPGCGSCTPR
jgi:tetratricopeptide (TPR) repeat protein